jgi:hypothetical protein
MAAADAVQAAARSERARHAARARWDSTPGRDQVRARYAPAILIRALALTQWTDEDLRVLAGLVADAKQKTDARA